MSRTDAQVMTLRGVDILLAAVTALLVALPPVFQALTVLLQAVNRRRRRSP